MRGFVLAIMVALWLAPAAAQAAQAMPYTTSSTKIGTLLDDPNARAVVDAHIPGFSSGAHVDLIRSMTLRGLNQVSPGSVTDQALADIDTDLARLAAH